MDDLDQKLNYKEENLILEIEPGVDGSWNLQKPEGGFSQLKVSSDGSCLFNSITLALEDSVSKSDEVRQTVAAIIISDPSKYNKSFLGGSQDPENYAEWICKPQEWGGIPELKILSEYYAKEICVVDIGEAKIHKFG